MKYAWKSYSIQSESCANFEVLANKVDGREDVRYYYEHELIY